jgi:hypothetical protein
VPDKCGYRYTKEDECQFSKEKNIAFYSSHYAILRQLSSNVGDHAAAEMFRAKWFACQAQEKRASKFNRLLIRAYGLGSTYGTDPFRPLVLLAATTATFLLVYVFLASAHYYKSLSSAAVFTLQQILSPFGMASGRTESSTGQLDQPDLLLTLIATTQSLISVTLLGLFLQSVYRVFNRD